jgi:hypothetical protein
VNTKLKEHNRSVYSAPSQRHVAEQIDALYWKVVSENDMQADQDSVIVTKGTDLTQPEYVPTVSVQYISRALLTPSQEYPIPAGRLQRPSHPPRRLVQLLRIRGYPVQRPLRPPRISIRTARPATTTTGTVQAVADLARTLHKCARKRSAQSGDAGWRARQGT